MFCLPIGLPLFSSFVAKFTRFFIDMSHCWLIVSQDSSAIQLLPQNTFG